MGVVVCGLSVGCAGSGGALRAALSSGLHEASTSVSSYIDDLTRVGQTGSLRIPSSLDEALSQADEAVRGGMRLTEEENALLARGERWTAFIKKFNQVLTAATGWEASIPDDAVRLANASFVSKPSREFHGVVQELEKKVLKGLMCEAARDGLDQAGDEQAATVRQNYDSVGHSVEDVAQYIQDGLAGWDGVAAVIDVEGLASASIEQVNEHLRGAMDVIESPDGTVRAANIIYFRTCIAKAG